jgi:hypothetical protein
MIFNEMEYLPEPKDGIKKAKLLAEGRHLGYRYVVISYMTHPCCYIQISDKNHPLYKKHYTNIVDLTTEGTLSYSRRYLRIPDEIDPEKFSTDYNGWWIGWDYMRTGYHNFDIPEEQMSERQKEIASRHKWTTAELVDECFFVIFQLNKRTDWTDIFKDWTEPYEYQKNKEKGHIEALKDINKSESNS